MRIVAGSRGGRRLRSVAGRGTRPTPDRVREALFSILADRVSGARFLDLYAGTGAVGLEALSRGAEFVLFVESGRAARAVIEENIAHLEFEDVCRMMSRRLPGALESVAERERPFDLVFADPPYRTGSPDRLLASDALAGVTAPGALVIMETEKGAGRDIGSWQQVDARTYGDTSLLFYKAGEES